MFVEVEVGVGVVVVVVVGVKFEGCNRGDQSRPDLVDFL